MLAGIAILLGTTAVTAMLALATTIGDRIHKELAVYGANIIVYPKADQLEVKVGGVDIKPASSGDLPERKRPRQTQNNLLGKQHHRHESRAHEQNDARSKRYEAVDPRVICTISPQSSQMQVQR